MKLMRRNHVRVCVPWPFPSQPARSYLIDNAAAPSVEVHTPNVPRQKWNVRPFCTHTLYYIIILYMPIWIKIMLRCRTIVVCRGLVSVTHDSRTRVQKEIAIGQKKKKKTIKYMRGKKSKRRPALFGNFHVNSNGFKLYTKRAHRCVHTGWSVVWCKT